MKKIAIFIPAYNASKTIIETLEGIQLAAAFAGLNLPLYVYDDCSHDDTFDIAKTYKSNNLFLQVFKNSTNLGERGTINVAFKNLATNYEWVLMIHADDIPKKKWIKTTYDVINTCDDSEIFSVWSSYDSFEDTEGRIYLGDDEGSIVKNKRQPKDGNFYLSKVTSSWHVSGAAINLSLFKSIGQFDSSMAQYGDTEFFAKAIMKGFNDVYIRRTLTNYRVIKSSVSFVSKNTNRDIREMFDIIDKYSLVLSMREKRKVLLLALNYTFRRTIKSLLKGNLDAFSKAGILAISCLKRILVLQ